MEKLTPPPHPPFPSGLQLWRAFFMKLSAPAVVWSCLRGINVRGKNCSGKGSESYFFFVGVASLKIIIRSAHATRRKGVCEKALNLGKWIKNKKGGKFAPVKRSDQAFKGEIMKVFFLVQISFKISTLFRYDMFFKKNFVQFQFVFLTFIIFLVFYELFFSIFVYLVCLLFYFYFLCYQE